MPLNVPKNYLYAPNPVGSTRLVTRAARRSRLYEGGTFFRSIRRGQDANLLRLAVIEDIAPQSSTQVDQGILVVQDLVLKPKDQIFFDGANIPEISVYSLSLGWNEEIRIFPQSGALRAVLYGISWQIGGAESLIEELGIIQPGKIFTVKNRMSIKIDSAWAMGLLKLKPRVKIYILEQISVPSQDGLSETTGWDIEALRALIDNDETKWVTMPIRAGVAIGAEPPGADKQDTGEDDVVLSQFMPTFMGGGDGLPATPAGNNTGPDRTLIHLNYSEVDDGSLGVLNQIFEWAGESSSVGSWQRYS